MSVATADLCDQHIEHLRILHPIFQDFGANHSFYGQVATVKVFEDNVLVREALQESGESQVLVVDGGGSYRCALIGDKLVQLAIENGWNGIVVYGCIRDTKTIGKMPLGVKALNASPVKSIKRGEGRKNVQTHFAGTTINPGDFLYADTDGIVLANEALHDHNY